MTPAGFYSVVPRGPLNDAEVRAAASLAALRGTSRRPDPPRDVRYAPSSRGALITWERPARMDGVVGYRIYRGAENSLHHDIRDPQVRQYVIELSSGDEPPITNVFVSSLNAANRESPRVAAPSKAKVEAGAPPAADPPAEFYDFYDPWADFYLYPY